MSCPRIPSAVAIVLAGRLLAGCGSSDLVLPGDGGGDGSREPATIRVVAGDGQSGQVGELLTEPVVIEVTDPEGQPVEGATVAFELMSAGDGGEVLPATAPTGPDGRVEARILLGDKVGLQAGEARVILDAAAVPAASFSAHARPEQQPNRSPRSDFNWHCDDLTCQFTDASDDEDGNVVARSWSFGDGRTSEANDPSHAYSEAGRYTVTLTVTDDDGATDETSDQVNVTAQRPPPPPPPAEPNKAPKADFDAHCSGMTCTFIDKSKDDDGTIVGRLWSFGDGATSNELNPLHVYAGPGKYNVFVTVTDDRGAANTKLRDVKVKD